MFRACFILILTFSYQLISGQQAFIGFGSKLGTYSMKDLDRFQKYRLESTMLPLETTESYPATLGYHFETGQYLDAFISKWGIFYNFNSTGARSTISDYSGRFDLDAVISSHQLGLSSEHRFKQKNSWAIGMYCEAGAIYSELRTLDFFNLVGAVSKTYKIEYDLIAFGGFAEAGISLNYKFKFLSAAFKFGYLNDISAVFHEKGFKERMLFLNGKKVKPGWDGLRAGLELNILFPGKNKPKPKP